MDYYQGCGVESDLSCFHKVTQEFMEVALLPPFSLHDDSQIFPSKFSLQSFLLPVLILPATLQVLHWDLNLVYLMHPRPPSLQ